MIKERRLLIFCYTLGILSLIIYGEFIIHFHANITTYMIFVLFFILLSLHLFISGIIYNKKENYRKNILIYGLLYFILLVTLTSLINRPNFVLFDAKYLTEYFYNVNLIPFKTIWHFLTGNINIGIKIYNLLGNFIVLMPLVLLLILYDSSYEKYKKTTIFVFLTVLTIELLQFFLATGRFDIDDFLLNIGGALFFLFLIKKSKLKEPLKKFFHSDFNLTYNIKLILYFLAVIAIIIMDVIFVVELTWKDENTIKIEEYFQVKKSNDLHEINLDGFNIYLDGVDVSFKYENEYYNLKDAFSNEYLSKDNLESYIPYVEKIKDGEVKVYKNEYLTIVSCNKGNNKNIYVSDKLIKDAESYCDN